MKLPLVITLRTLPMAPGFFPYLPPEATASIVTAPRLGAGNAPFGLGAQGLHGQGRGDADASKFSSAAASRASAPGASPAKAVGSMSETQWLVYFCFELSAIAPEFTDAGVLALAMELRGWASGVRPECAAAGMAVGTRRILIH